MDNNYLLFEQVAPNGDVLDSRQFAPLKFCTQLLAAAEAVWAKLSADTRQSLNKPLANHLLVRFKGKEFFCQIAPGRARAALAVEEALLAVRGLALDCENIESRAAIFDFRRGRFFTGEYRIPVGLVLARMRREAGVPGPAVKEVWQCILAVLLEDENSVPGIRVRQVGA